MADDEGGAKHSGKPENAAVVAATETNSVRPIGTCLSPPPPPSLSSPLYARMSENAFAADCCAKTERLYSSGHDPRTPLSRTTTCLYDVQYRSLPQLYTAVSRARQTRSAGFLTGCSRRPSVLRGLYVGRLKNERDLRRQRPAGFESVRDGTRCVSVTNV